MQFSSLTSTSLPRSLPLTGPDYRVTVGKETAGASRTVTKSGPLIQVESANPADRLTLRSDPDGLTYSHEGNLPSHLYRRGNQVAIRRPDGRNVVITRSGDQIGVDRPGIAGDVTFTRTPRGLTIDRYGSNNDVKIEFDPNQVTFQYGEPGRDTVITLTPGLEFDPVAFQEETTLDSEGLALLEHWFEKGLQPTDLLCLTQRGDLIERDDLLR